MAFSSLLSRLAQLPLAFKAAAIALLAVSVIGVMLVGIVTHPAQEILFSRALRPEQLSEVEEQLAEWNVAFTPEKENVLVDQRRRNALLLRLSLEGVPHSHVATSSETLATIGVLTPQTVIDAQTRSGLAGDIELALRGVEGVDDARVIIAPAKAAEFADERGRDATASVRLHLHDGTRLTHASIQGIRAFVAASVPGLSAANVTLLDDRGVALGMPDSNSGDDASALQSSLQSALDGALGSGASIVRVREEYSSTERERRDLRRTPLGTPVVTNAASESFADSSKRYQKNEERDDRGSDVREDVARIPAGTLERISTAVFVDASRGLALPAVRALAAAAVGYDPKRGDTLTVAAVDFHAHNGVPRDRWVLIYNLLQTAVPVVALLLGMLVFMKFATPHLAALVRAHLERTSVTRTRNEVAGFAPSQVRGALAHEPPHAAAAVISALPAATAAAVLELYPAHEREQIVKRMQRTPSAPIPDIEEVLRAGI